MFDSIDLFHKSIYNQFKSQHSNYMKQPSYCTVKPPKMNENLYQITQNQYFTLENNESLPTNDEEITKSRTYFWNNVYNLHAKPFYSFFNNKQLDKPSQPASAQSAWAKFNPERQTNFELDVFKMLKEQKETTDNSQLEMDSPQRQSPLSFPEQKQAILFEVNKPPPFMGAFTHVQPEFNFFNLNVAMPTSQQYKPFSCFYQEQAEQIEEKYDASYLNVSKISAIQDIKKQNNHKYFFQLQSVQSEISEIVEQNKKEQLNTQKQQQKNQQNGEKSLLWNYSELFQERSDFKHRDPIWQQPAIQKQGKQSKIFQVKKEWSQQILHQMESQLNLAEEMKLIIPDEYILSELSKLMQNVESDLFTLDYIKMEWSMDLGNFRLQHSFKSSLKYRVKDMLTIANYRSRIDAAIQYIRKRPFRRVYYQLGVQITEILIIFEEIVLTEAKTCNLVQFFSHIEKLKLEMTLLYKLLINQAYITDEGRSYEDFDYRYLNSQYVIFKQVVKQSKIADSLHIEMKPMITTLLCSVFKPITVILNNILFQECAVIELNEQIYLKYFFDSHKDIIQFVSRKIALIKGENHQLYQVCRMRDTIQILNDLTQLQRYQYRWQSIFAQKRKLIERIRKNHKLKVKSQRERKREQRMKFIYSLKSRIYQQNQEENARKKQANTKNKEQLQKLKKQIDARQQRRKLLQQLEKEKEKGLILDIALQEKQRLQKEKQTLLMQMNELNGQNIETKIQSQANNVQKPEMNKVQSVVSAVQQSIPHPKLQNKTSIKQKQVKPSQAVSQQQIKSTNSIQSNKMVFTADNFMLRKDRNSSKISNNTQSYFRLANKHHRQSLELDSPPSSDYSIQAQQLSQQQKQFEPLSVQLSINRELDLNTSLQVCFSDIIKKQLQIIQSSLSFLIMDKYQLLSLLNFMRNVFMSGNGQRIQEFINVAIDQNSMLNLKYFSQCLLFDTSPENIQKLEPFFYHSKRQTKYNTEINIFQDNVENYIGFQFRKLPGILQSYFAYTHISRYMQIFGFILRLRYSEKLINNSWKLLNNYKKGLQEKQRNGEDVDKWLKLLNRLYSVRYIINNFLITFQCYMFQKIIEKQFKILKQNMNNLHDLQANHLKMLDNIIRYTFVDNPNQNVTKNLRRNLSFIHEFYQIINQLTLDDIPTCQLKQTHERITMIQTHFRREQGWMQALIQKMI